MSSRTKRNKLILRKLARKFKPSEIRRHYDTKHIIADIAEKHGLVYFGYVDQKDDEHRLIRGHTTSTTHVDNHYCVGTVQGYDMSLALRADSITTADGKVTDNSWLLLQVDLRTLRQAPRVFIGHHSGITAFKSKYTQLLPMSLPLPPGQAPRFAQQFVVFANPAHFEQVLQLITPQTVEVIAAHFGNVSIEIDDDILYVSQPSTYVTRAQVETIITNTVWLAQALDAQAAALARVVDQQKTPQ